MKIRNKLRLGTDENMGVNRRFYFLLKAFATVTKTRLFSKRPFLFSHLITSRCNCRCPMCLWKGYSQDELSTDHILSIYEDAKRNGFVSLVIWGGEPLIRGDIAQIIQSAYKMGFVTLLITNGYHLPEVARGISPNLSALIVSIDFPSEKHDELRGCPGLFCRAVDGIREAKLANPNLKLSINCVITKLNMFEIRDMIMLADRLGVSITFESMNSGMPFSELDVSPLKPPPEDEREVFKQIRYYKRKGYKINNSFAYLNTFISGKKRYECHSLEASLCMQSNGDVRICLSKEPLANLTKTPISEVLSMKKYKEYQKLSHRCCICNDYGTVECSYIWRLDPQAVLGTALAFVTP